MLSTPTPDTAAFAPIAGFWRRVAAFLVDAVILGLMGYALSLRLFDAFVSMGPWGRGFGFVIAMAYFVPQEVAHGGGQSLGKRLLRIRVVDAQGRALGPVRSIARFAVFGVPYFLDGVMLPMNVTMFAGGIPFALLAPGALLALAYLLVFNRRTRQSLHDLAVGAFVVRVARETRVAPTPGPARAWGGHLAIAAVLMLLVGAVPLLYPQIMRIPLFAGLSALSRRLSAEPGLRSVSVLASERHGFGIGTSDVQRELLIQGTMETPPTDYVPLSTRLAGIALATYPDAARADRITVRIAHGFDIGIASHWDANTLSLTPDQWADRVAAGVGGPAN